MKATSSGVAISAAKIRSPSFSRSSSSMTTTALPAAMSATALSTESNLVIDVTLLFDRPTSPSMNHRATAVIAMARRSVSAGGGSWSGGLAVRARPSRSGVRDAPTGESARPPRRLRLNRRWSCPSVVGAAQHIWRSRPPRGSPRCPPGRSPTWSAHGWSESAKPRTSPEGRRPARRRSAISRRR